MSNFFKNKNTINENLRNLKESGVIGKEVIGKKMNKIYADIESLEDKLDSLQSKKSII